MLRSNGSRPFKVLELGWWLPWFAVPFLLAKAVPEAWYLTDRGARMLQPVVALFLAAVAVAAVVLALRGRAGGAQAPEAGRKWRLLGWVAFGLWVATAWPTKPGAGAGPSLASSAGLLFASVAMLAFAWFLYRVLWQGGSGRVSSGVLILTLLVLAAAGFTTVASPTWQAAGLWLLGLVLAIASLPVVVVERWLRARRPRPPNGAH